MWLWSFIKLTWELKDIFHRNITKDLSFFSDQMIDCLIFFYLS